MESVSALESELIRPRQQRSKASLERMLSATEDLLLNRDFSQITVVDIAAHAGVTPGLIYSRFRKKDDILPFLLKRYLRGHLKRFPAATADFAASTADMPEAIVEFLIKHLNEEFQHCGGVVRATGARHLSGKQDLDGEEHDLTRRRIDMIVSWIAQKLIDSGAHEDTARDASVFVFQSISMTLQIFFLFDAGQTPLSVEKTVAELKLSLTGYMRSKLTGHANNKG